MDRPLDVNKSTNEKVFAEGSGQGDQVKGEERGKIEFDDLDFVMFHVCLPVREF